MKLWHFRMISDLLHLLAVHEICNLHGLIVVNFQKICVGHVNITMNTIKEYLELGKVLPSKHLVSHCAKVGKSVI